MLFQGNWIIPLVSGYLVTDNPLKVTPSPLPKDYFQYFVVLRFITIVELL